MMLIERDTQTEKKTWNRAHWHEWFYMLQITPTIEQSPVKMKPTFSCWTCCWCSWQRAGWGYPGGSSPVPPPSLWLGWWSGPDVIAGKVSKHLPRQHAFQQTQNRIQAIMIPLVPAYSTSEPRHRACSRRHTFTHSALFKESFNWFKAVFKSERRQRVT